MADKNKTPKMARPGLGLLGGTRKDKIKDRKEKLTKEQKLMRKENFFTNAEKGYRKAESDYKKVDPGFKKRKSDDNKITDSIIDSSMGKSGEMIKEMKASNREAGRTSRARGGRIGYKGGKSVKKKGGCAIKGRSPILR
jgi:hypothetical protein